MIKFIIFFSIIQLINVILNTFRTCVTAKGNKIAATLITAICYGFYTFVIVFTADNCNIWVKAGITVITNLIGVYFSMLILEKLRKDRLWEIVVTIKEVQLAPLQDYLIANNISHNVQALAFENGYVIHIYSKNQKESAIVKTKLKDINAKYIVHEENAKL